MKKKLNLIFPEETKTYTDQEIWQLQCPNCQNQLTIEFPVEKEGMASASCCNRVYGIYPRSYQIIWDEIC